MTFLWGRALNIGLPRIIPKSGINLGLGRILGLYAHDFYFRGENGVWDSPGGVSSAEKYPFDVWMENSIEFDSGAEEITWKVVNKETRFVYSYLTYDATGIQFSNELNRLGVGNDPIGYRPSLWTDNPDEYQETEFDNIHVEYQQINHLFIDLTSDREIYVPGQSVNYSIILNNLTNQDLDDVEVTVNLTNFASFFVSGCVSPACQINSQTPLVG